MSVCCHIYYLLNLCRVTFDLIHKPLLYLCFCKIIDTEPTEDEIPAWEEVKKVLELSVTILECIQKYSSAAEDIRQVGYF